MANGACIGVWIKNMPDVAEKRYLWNYSDIVVKKIYGHFTLDFRILKFNWFERMQIKRAIGYVPKCEIYVCGGLDCIFLATEMVMRRYGGYNQNAISWEDTKSKNIKGEYHTYYSIRFRYGRLDIRKEYFYGADFFHEYYNHDDPDEVWKSYSFDPE